jgi:hypothetical protein
MSAATGILNDIAGTYCARILLQVKLAALPGHTGGYYPPGCLESLVGIADDQLDATQRTILQ